MKANDTQVTMFTLSGLSGVTNYRFTLFALTLLCYCVIWMVNVTIIVTVIAEKSLHEPMYVFLCNLCINGLYGTSGFYPKFLCDLLSTSHAISYAGCLLQAFVLHSSASADLSILVIMALDRYVAICRPLVYHSVMSPQRVCALVFIGWLLPLYLVFVGSVTTSRSILCGSHIPKIYCINLLIGNLACTPSMANVIVPAFNYTFYCLHLFFIIWSYAYLLRTCRGSRENWSKFMQTCLPHLFCLITFAVTLIFDLMYMRFGSKTLPQSIRNFLAIEFLLIPPIVNPLIYGLKMTQIRNRISQTLFCKHLW